MKGSELLFVCLVLLSSLRCVATAQEGTNLTMLGEVHDFVQQTYDVAIAGDYAVVASGMTSGLRMLDLSDPSTPVEVGYAVLDDPCPGVSQWMADRVTVSGTVAYVLYFDGTWSATHYRLYVYDVSDPSLPVQQGCLTLPDNCTSLFAQGGRVYVTAFEMAGFSGVKVIDVSNPVQPREVGSFETPGLPHSIAVEGSVAYVADNDGLVAYNVSDPASPSILGRYEPPGEQALLHEVVVHGDHVFLLDATFGLRILDASDHTRMREVASFPHRQEDAYSSRMVLVGETLCYLQCGDVRGNELVLLDVSAPEAPKELGVYQLPGEWWFYGFDCLGGIACVAAGEHGLIVMDVSDPAAAEQVGCYHPPGPAFGMAIAGNYAFVSTRRDSHNVVIFDVSDPTSPIEVNTITVEGRPFWLSVWGSRLFVPGMEVDQVPGVLVLDISDPVRPVRAGWLPCPPQKYGVPLSVECIDRYAVVAMAYGGVQIYDIADLEHPVALDGWTRWDPVSNQGFAVRNVKVAWPYLFAPDEAFGLYVLDISDPSDIVEVAHHQTPGAAWWVDLSPEGDYLFLSDFSRGVRVLDVSHPPTPVEIAHYEGNLAEVTHLRASGDSLYLTDGGGIGLHVLDVSNPSTLREVACHRTAGVHALDVIPAGSLVYCLDETHFQVFELVSTPSAVDLPRPGSVRSSSRIESVYPNPFNAATTIIFTLTEPGHVALRLYALNGQEVRTLVDAPYGTGRYVSRFQGDALASGAYLLRLEVNGRVDVYGVTLLK